MPPITWLNIAFIYIVTWCILIFTILPIGVKREENPEAGHSAGAPQKPDLKRKFIINTVLSALVTWGIVLLLQSGLIPLREVVH